MKKLPINFSKSSSQSSDLELIENLSVLLDSRFSVPGTKFKFGIDSLVGLIPGLGDVLTSTLSLFIVYKASIIGVSKRQLIRMLWNIIIDATLGVVPILGDIFDFAYKSNLKNINIIKEERRQGNLNRRDSKAVYGLLTYFSIIFISAIIFLIAITSIIIIKIIQFAF